MDIMQVNGYHLNLSEEELNIIINEQTRSVELIDTNFATYKQLEEGDKKALSHLYKAATIINDVALEQDNPYNRSIAPSLQRLSFENALAAKAYALFKSFNGVAGYNGIAKEPIQVFKELKLLKGRNFYPEDLSVEEFHRIIIEMTNSGKIDEIRRILSARTMVRRQENELIAIDYTQYFAREFSLIANELEVAAHYCTEPAFKDYLNWQAQALLQENPQIDMLADKHWAILQNNKLEFTISRENYEDEMTGTVFDNPEIVEIIEKHNIEVISKDTLGCRVGIVNQESTEKILASKQTLPHLASWLPYNEQYEQTNVSATNLKQTMVDVDLIALTGDYAMCRGGITTAQNLPNNDKLAVKTGGGRRNVYHRQVRLATDKQREQALLNKLIAPQLHSYVDSEKIIDFVVGHENGHSLGPDSSYQNALGTYKHIIEEHKANTISIAAMEEIAKKFNSFNDEDLKKIYTTWVVSDLLLKAQPILSAPHRIADLMEFNYLLEHKVIWFDDDKKLNINFDNISQVMYQLLEETIKVQLSKSVDSARDFVNRWTTWGEWSEYIANVQQEIGIKPYINIITKF